MKRRDLLAAPLLAGALAVPPGLARAAVPSRPWRIWAITYRGRTDVERGFADFFAQRGIAVDITWRDIALDPARLPALVDEIRRLPAGQRPDLIHTWGTGVTLGLVGRWDAQDRTRDLDGIPVVFSLVASPVGAGIVRDAQVPGRPVTGVSHMASLAAQLQAMASYRPGRTLGRLAMLYSANEPNSAAVLAALQQLGRTRGFELQARAFRVDAAGRSSAEGAADTVRELAAGGADWLYLPPDSFLNTQAREVVIPAALAAGLPAFASTEQLMAAGALLGLFSRYYNVGQFAAHKALRILLEGVPAGQIPIESLSRFALQIRLPVARRLGLLPPLAMFNYAELIGDARSL